MRFVRLGLRFFILIDEYSLTSEVHCLTKRANYFPFIFHCQSEHCVFFAHSQNNYSTKNSRSFITYHFRRRFHSSDDSSKMQLQFFMCTAKHVFILFNSENGIWERVIIFIHSFYWRHMKLTYSKNPLTERYSLKYLESSGVGPRFISRTKLYSDQSPDTANFFAKPLIFSLNR